MIQVLLGYDAVLGESFPAFVWIVVENARHHLKILWVR